MHGRLIRGVCRCALLIATRTAHTPRRHGQLALADCMTLAEPLWHIRCTVQDGGPLDYVVCCAHLRCAPVHVDAHAAPRSVRGKYNIAGRSGHVRGLTCPDEPKHRSRWRCPSFSPTLTLHSSPPSSSPRSRSLAFMAAISYAHR